MLGYWRDDRTDTEYVWDNAPVEVTVTDNPVVHQLLDHHGNALRQWRERPPIGYATNGDTMTKAKAQHVIGDPRQAGEEGPAGDMRMAGEDGPAGDTRMAGEEDVTRVVGNETTPDLGHPDTNEQLPDEAKPKPKPKR